MQELCNLRRVLESQTDQGEDADIGGQPVLLLGVDLHLWLQQSVEVVDEIGEEVQEYGVEVLVELIQFLFLQFRRFRHLEEFIELLVLHFLVHHLSIVVELVDILCTETHEAADVFLLHTVALC